MNSLLTKHAGGTGRLAAWSFRWSKHAVFALASSAAAFSALAVTPLADRPLFATANVPGNLVLALSVEFPTAVTAADRSTTYSTSTKYLGYFDSAKCYTYRFNEVVNGSYFYPDGATGTAYSCSGKWSGNFLNWATMQAIDPFRSAMTGGYRSIDSDTTTILEKAVAPNGQGSAGSNFPNKSLGSGVSSATPFTSTNFNMHVSQCGTRMIFSLASGIGGDSCPASTVWDGVVNTPTAAPNTVFSLEVRVKVCSTAADKEANCVQYGSNYKPEGLIQKYASKIRYSAFGYVVDPLDNNTNKLRGGGVLRARMKFVGPTQPVPGSSPIPNVKNAVAGQITTAEWSASTGRFIGNPDEDDATASSQANSVVGNSGVINYLNQFGRSAQVYKRFDNVSELYYSATRYLRGLPNVAEYTDISQYNGTASTPANRTTMKDGFPIISAWTDPVLYSCQKNFVLGIGDTNTHLDKDLPGNTTYRSGEPATTPQAISDDFTINNINVIEATNKVGVLEGTGTTIGATNAYNGNQNSAYIAGLAYLFNTKDMRPDLIDSQTISTYWLDVLEGSDYKAAAAGRNQFYLAAKYGGFSVPKNYSYDTATALLPQALWSTTGDTIPIPSAAKPRPDNYFVANQADKMVSGLESAFSKIASTVDAFTTSFSTSLPQVAAVGNSSFSSKYDPAAWTGEVTASELTFDTSGVPTVVVPAKWNFSAKLATQLAGSGWDGARRVVTWNGSAGVAFRASGTSKIDATDLGRLDTSYTTGDDSVDYLNYLRGDTTNEAGNAAGTKAYRTRTKLIGDIVGSKATPVGPPSFPYSDVTNPGYSAFKNATANKTRRTVVYVGANDGMMHAINGALVTTATTPPLETDAAAGTEMFAYVPRELFRGPNSTPNVDGLASLGNPAFVHHFMVNATPTVHDIDFARTPDASGNAATGNPSPDWRSVLIGGLGKGGRAYYGIDVTDPAAMAASETVAASKVLWEFNNDSLPPLYAGALGYTYGEPIVVKTAKYGWVVVLVSGYNNVDGKGYFFFVNPKTGAFLAAASTLEGSPANSAGLAHPNAFVVDASDGTADAIYAGDLLGNLWRLDVTGTSAFSTPSRLVKLASLTDASLGNPQPVTSRPSIEVHPGSTKKRFVLVGTGRLLDDTDIASTQGQTFYAIADGTNAQFNPTGAPLSFPYTRSVLAVNSNALVGVNFDPLTQAGWLEELGVDTGTPATPAVPATPASGSTPASPGKPAVPAIPATGIAWRVTSDSTTLSGSVAFAATLPNGSVCTPSGNSRVYARDYAAATTTLRTLVNNALTPSLYVSLGGNVTDLRYLSVNGRAVLISGTDTGNVGKIEINPLGNLQLRRLNWRELPVVE